MLRELISVVHPNTFGRWVRKYKAASYPKEYDQRGPKIGRPRTPQETRELVIRIARETGLGYMRIKGELFKLGIELSTTTITNILKGVGMVPDPRRGEGRWDEFIKMHAQTLWACDFFSVRGMTLRGFRQFYMILFIHIGSRRIHITPASMNPTQPWVHQQAREFCSEVEKGGWKISHILRDQDKKLDAQFNAILKGQGAQVVRLSRHSPNLNAFAERAIQSVKHECLNHFVICGERHLNHLIREYVDYYNTERPHSAIGSLPPVRGGPPTELGEIRCRSRLGGLLKHYYRQAA